MSPPTPGPTAERSASRAPDPFAVYTLVDDETKYGRMVESLVAAGFPRERIERLPEADDPHAAITRLGTSSDVRYPIICDQDAIADPESGAADLLKALEQLDQLDSGWAVAGYAGVDRAGQFVRRVAGPGGVGNADGFPRRVVSLDEAFLILNPRNRPSCSPGLSGSHLYGADVSLNAIRRGGSAYVVDFMLNHTGVGRNEASYRGDLKAFTRVWQSRFGFAYVFTSFDALCLSRWPVLRRVFGSTFVMGCVAAARFKPAS